MLYNVIIQQRWGMKVIFLDIDGVLNSIKFDRLRMRDGRSDFIDESRLPLLKQIVDSTDAVIVLSTTWRVHWDKNEILCDNFGKYMVDTFAKYGLTIYDKTPYLGIMAERYNEIKDWLEYADGVESFVIIDDYQYGWGDLQANYVKTEPYFRFGLEEEHVKKAIEVLNK